jgi:hypothetical protein
MDWPSPYRLRFMFDGEATFPISLTGNVRHISPIRCSGRPPPGGYSPTLLRPERNQNRAPLTPRSERRVTRGGGVLRVHQKRRGRAAAREESYIRARSAYFAAPTGRAGLRKMAERPCAVEPTVSPSALPHPDTILRTVYPPLTPQLVARVTALSHSPLHVALKHRQHRRVHLGVLVRLAVDSRLEAAVVPTLPMALKCSKAWIVSASAGVRNSLATFATRYATAARRPSRYPAGTLCLRTPCWTTRDSRQSSPSSPGSSGCASTAQLG